MGSFICQNCGKEFAHYSKSPREMGRKYCKECADKIKNDRLDIGYKIIKCLDCGEEIKIDILDNKTSRCVDCQEKRNLELHKIRSKKYRENLKT